MAIARAELARRARDLAGRVLDQWLLPAAGVAPADAPRWAVALAGSGASGYRDASSRVDLVVVGPAAGVERARATLARRPDGRGPGSCHLLPDWAGGGNLVLLAWEELSAAVAAPAEETVILLASADPLVDPAGRLARALAALRPLPPEWYRARIAEHYRSLRRRTASIAWNLRRGQAFAFLAGFVQWLEHLLLLCRYADGEPPVERKWLLQAAMRTSLGRELRAEVYDLLSRLGEVATLGGSYDPKENRLYGSIAGLHGRLAASLRQRGLLDDREEPREETS